MLKFRHESRDSYIRRRVGWVWCGRVRANDVVTVVLPFLLLSDAFAYPLYYLAVSLADTDPEPTPPVTQLLSLSAQGGKIGVFS